MYFIKNLIAKTDTRKAVNTPAIKIAISNPVQEKPNFTNFRALAPSITGIAKKKVNSAATKREAPNSKAVIIVTPEREVPGMSANSWNTPIKNAIV